MLYIENQIVLVKKDSSNKKKEIFARLILIPKFVE